MLHWPMVRELSHSLCGGCLSWELVLLGALLLVQQGLLMSITAVLPNLLHASISAGVPLELLSPSVLPEGGRIYWGAASGVGSEGPELLSSAQRCKGPWAAVWAFFLCER